MSPPVKLELSKNGRIFEERIVEGTMNLRCRIEMMTGVGWLDATPLYRKMLDENCAEISETFRVCHSYEKWGGWQQEMVNIKVRMQRLEC